MTKKQTLSRIDSAVHYERPKATFSLLSAIVSVGVIAFLSGCAQMQRSPQSTYYGRDEDLNFGRDRKIAEREATLADLGLSSSRDLSDREAEAIDLRITVNKAERNLEGRREREQYFKNKPYLRNDRERLEFLKLGSYESRNHWLNTHGIQTTLSTHSPGVQALVDSNDIALGMTKNAVRESWGEPDLVEVAGNPIYGNERWHYTEQTSSTEGYRTQQRLVYFESGRVSGWESR